MVECGIKVRFGVAVQSAPKVGAKRGGLDIKMEQPAEGG